MIRDEEWWVDNQPLWGQGAVKEGFLRDVTSDTVCLFNISFFFFNIYFFTFVVNFVIHWNETALSLHFCYFVKRKNKKIFFPIIIKYQAILYSRHLRAESAASSVVLILQGTSRLMGSCPETIATQPSCSNPSTSELKWSLFSEVKKRKKNRIKRNVDQGMGKLIFIYYY